MIVYRVDGRSLVVTMSDIDEGLADLQLSVVVDRRETIAPAHITAADDGWRVDLAAELYDEKPHRIALEVASSDRSVDRIAFSFAASTRTVSLPSRASPGASPAA